MSFIMSFDVTDTFTLEITLFTHFFVCHTTTQQHNVQFDLEGNKMCNAHTSQISVTIEFGEKKNGKIKKGK